MKKKGFVGVAADSSVMQLLITLATYSVYAALIGISLVPAGYLVIAGYRVTIHPSVVSGDFLTVGGMTVMCLVLAGSLYVFIFTALMVIAVFNRLMTAGFKEGRYPQISLVTLRWMLSSGAFTFAFRALLPLVPMTFFSQTFYRISGAKIGKGVWINTYHLVDPYMISIDDGAIIGGEAVLSGHTFEGGYLYLGKIRIGKNCMIGAHSYISPGVTIGDETVVGMHCYIRKDKKIAEGSTLTSLAGMPVGRAREIERGEC